MTFLVDIPIYSGPLDLLLHIVRRDEIALEELPLAPIVEQYVNYLEVLVELQIDDVGDFLEIASLLIEMKAKQSVPSAEDAEDGGGGFEISDMSDDLISRLMEYKRIRDAASILEDQSAKWQLRYSRLANDLPARRHDSGQPNIEPIEVWDLVSAFGRILRERQPPAPTNVIYDDKPIHIYMEEIHQRVRLDGRVELTSLFKPGMHKSSLVAMFLATLELTRHYGLGAEQQDAGHPLYLTAGRGFREDAKFSVGGANSPNNPLQENPALENNASGPENRAE